MKPLSTGIVTAALVAGLAGSVMAYRSVTDVEAAAAPTTPAVVETSAAPTPEARPQRKVRVRWAPCEPPARLVDGACVTEVVKTVVLPPPPPPAPSPRVAAVAGTGTASVGDRDGDDDHEGYEGHEGEDDDHEDDDHEDDDHEDDD